MRLKELREEKGLKQSDLGNILGYSQNAISKWELSKTEPKIKDLIALADYFDVSIDYLLERTDDIFLKDTKIGPNTEKEITLVNNFRKLKPDYQNRVIGYIDNFIKQEAEITNDDFKRRA